MKRYIINQDSNGWWSSEHNNGAFVKYSDIEPLLDAVAELHLWTEEQLEKALYNEEEVLKDLLNVLKEYDKL